MSLWRVAFVAWALLGTGAAVAAAPKKKAVSPAENAARLQALFSQEWQYALEQSPDYATGVGDSRYNDRLPDLSEGAIQARKEHTRALPGRLQAIDRARLSAADQLNYDLFRYNTERAVAALDYPEEWLQIDQMNGVHSYLSDLARVVPRRNVKDYEDFIKRLRIAPTYIDQVVVLLRKGAGAGVTPARVTLRDLAGLIDNQIAEDVKTTPIYTTVFKDGFPSAVSAAEQERLRTEAEAVLRESVLPALKRLRGFLEDEYLPKTRTTIAWSEVPNGRAWYQNRVREMSTTTLTPDEIHAIGLAEVQRIRGEMEKVKQEAGFSGSLAEFVRFLRTDPQFVYTEREPMLVAYRDLAKRIDAELPRLFGTLPRLPYGVAPVPAYSERTQPAGFYYPGSGDAGRAGQIFVNLYDLAGRPKWEMEPLMAHEGVPGHHLQIALAQELADIPRFRRHGGHTAYIEGWGLYSESLGSELGLYKDPYSRYGQLNFEIWRAIRLVVDTGLHWKGWTREQAIDYFKENSGSSEHDITVEVDRYIVWPGQALAYKLGELKIKELRARATKALESRFDVRKFHDMVLGAGSLPLPILEERVAAWIAREQTDTVLPPRSR
jgi:uncharacterized protein (DUF885 family)